MPKEVLVTKGQKRVSGRSSNTKGNDNIISNGSGIAVADGQCMIIVEQGKIVEVCAEPGEFTYDTSTEPSIFSGSLGDSIKQTFKTIVNALPTEETPVRISAFTISTPKSLSTTNSVRRTLSPSAWLILKSVWT